jgi:hypothetical protein
MSKKTTKCNKKNKGGTKRKRSNSAPGSRSRSPSRSRARTSRLQYPVGPGGSPESLYMMLSPQIDLSALSALGNFEIAGPNTLRDEIIRATHLNRASFTYDDEPDLRDLLMERSYAIQQHSKDSLIWKINGRIFFLEEKLEKARRARSITLIEQIESELAEKRRMLEYINTLSDTDIDNLNIEY